MVCTLDTEANHIYVLYVFISKAAKCPVRIRISFVAIGGMDRQGQKLCRGLTVTIMVKEAGLQVQGAEQLKMKKFP